MLFSKNAKLAGGSGFFFGGHVGAPVDAVNVSCEDVFKATNLPAGEDYDFDANGVLFIIKGPVPDAWQVRALEIATACGAIKAERDRRTDQGGFKVGSHWFHSDQKSRGQQGDLVILGDRIAADLQWKTMDGCFVTMTPALALEIISSRTANDQAVFAAAEAHIAAVESSDDPASYDFSAGWPDIYQN
jgi:hypothetical protein